MVSAWKRRRFCGSGTWTFEQDGDCVDVTYDGKIAAEKPLLLYYSVVMKPIFRWNRAWAMARGKQSLELEIARRRALTPDERAQVPLPPGPTKTAPAVAATFGAAAVLLRRLDCG